MGGGGLGEIPGAGVVVVGTGVIGVIESPIMDP